ncbi:hypothetical protein D1007_32740 [Hordeum vulgare]|nr:hypothetical protein D1007_32740 [Hordeum vulgare]
MPAPMGIDLNAMRAGGGLSPVGARKTASRAVEDEANPVFMESLVYEGGGGGIPFDPDETQSQDGGTPFMIGHDDMGYSFGEDMADPMTEDQLGLGSSSPLDHEFLKDYGPYEEDDEVDIDGEPLFDELPIQANANKKRNNKRTKASLVQRRAIQTVFNPFLRRSFKLSPYMCGR